MPTGGTVMVLHLDQGGGAGWLARVIGRSEANPLRADEPCIDG